ncbi:MAG: hypothetical protein FWE27_09675 [Defluviitaleaceae bacterium]|nr:hypothetical protein [Defluviitaleaceae bacterium]
MSRNHSNVDGLASSNNMDMIVAFTKDDEDFRKWITAHEISHLLGAPDNRCTPHDECVMRYTTESDDRWCANCINAIRSRR